MIILLDVDGVIADLVGHLCARLKRPYCDQTYTPEDFTHYDFGKVFRTSRHYRAAQELMSTPGFCQSIPWYPGAQEFVSRLKEWGTVVAVTKPYPTCPTWAWEREQWLKGHIDTVIHTPHKEYVHGDWLIEDSPENVIRWEMAFEEELRSRRGSAILLERPWCRGTHKSYEDILASVCS